MQLKIVLVTSQITYMPTNYLKLLEGLMEGAEAELTGLILLENLDAPTLKACLGLPLLGVKKLSFQLYRNILELPLKRREKLFENRQKWVRKFKTMNDPQVIQLIKEQEIDLIINLRTRCLYKEEILKAPKLACLNIHHGLLPEYRGTFCDLYALTENRPAGFSIHRMEKKVDAGEILACVEVSKGDKNYLTYLEKTSDREVEVLIQLIREIKKLGKIPQGKPNKTDKKTYTKNPTRPQIKRFLASGYEI